jgi:hypothetical protein
MTTQHLAPPELKPGLAEALERAYRSAFPRRRKVARVMILLRKVMRRLFRRVWK